MHRQLRSRQSKAQEKKIEEESTGKKQEKITVLQKQSKSKKKINRKLSIDPENFVMCKVGKFDHDYEIVDKIGEGSFGTVYKVKHKNLQLERALKTIEKKQNSIASTFSEIQVLKKLDHANILKIYQFYEAKDSYFIITEIFNGKELFDEIIQQEKLTQKTTSQIIREILIALNYTHSQGIAHRDIKPENILVKDIGTNKMKIKLIDWGLGAMLSGFHKSGRFCGTPDYAAPETYKGQYTTKCDMWSLGVLTYIMLTGQMPFKGKNTQDTMLQAQKGVLNFRRKNFSSLPTPSKQFIMSLIQKDSKKRLTAEEALNHPWIKQYKENQQEPEFLKQTLDRLKQITVANHFGLAVVNYVNNHLSSSEQKEKLQEIFRYLDLNGDGVLSSEEFIEGYSKLYGQELGSKIAQETFQKLDVNHNGSLQYSEFIAFGLQQKKQEEKLRLHEAFKHFDINKDGHISSKEISKILGSSVEGIQEEELETMISDFDENGDNEIDFEEFLNCISAIYRKMSEKKNNEK